MSCAIGHNQVVTNSNHQKSTKSPYRLLSSTMLTQVFSTTTLFLLVQSSFGSDVPKLTAANFEEKTDGKTVFIKAFAPCKLILGVIIER